MIIKVKGEEYNLRITFGGMMRYKDEYGKDLATEDGENMPLEDVYNFLYCCFKACALSDGKAVGELTKLDVMDGIDLGMMKELMGQLNLEMSAPGQDKPEEKKRQG